MARMETHYDVIVIGGGTAGVIAALQAGRAGAATLLVEKNGMLGGTVTVGGVNYPGMFFAWGRQVVAGIGWELVRRSMEETSRELPDFSDPTDPRWQRHVRVDKAVYAALCDEAVASAGVDLLLHAMPAAVDEDDAGWRVELCTKEGLRPATAGVVIDATGDANAVALAGFEVVRPDTLQPGTLVMRLGGYDPETLDYEAVDIAFRQALRDGEIRHTDVGWRRDGPGAILRSRGGNANHISAGPAGTSEGRTEAELEARRAMMRMYRFFRRQPGLEEFGIEWVCPEVAIRETAVIRGKETITGDDYVAGRRYDDAVCYCFYPVDIHLDDGEGVDFRELAPGTVPTIPRGAMLPAGSECLIAAGRCISGDRVAHSAYRVEATCMATGQAAGAMAAMSAAGGVDPEQLPIEEVRTLLRRHGAVVPWDLDQ